MPGGKPKYSLHPDGWLEYVSNPERFAREQVNRRFWRDLGVARSPAEFEELLSSIEARVQRLEQLGVTCIFVRFPSTREVAEIAANRYPRDAWWDKLNSRLPQNCVHFEQAPGAETYNCPDGSHLLSEDAVRWSKFLGGVVRNHLPSGSTDTRRASGRGR